MVLLTGPPNNAASEPEAEHQEQPGEPTPEPEAEQEQPGEPAPEFLVPRAPNTPVAPAQHQEAARRVSFYNVFLASSNFGWNIRFNQNTLISSIFSLFTVALPSITLMLFSFLFSLLLHHTS
jgi:hypothetical protein